jgi:hypothetical protein
MPQSKDQHREWMAKRRAQKRALVVVTPEVIKVPPELHPEVPLGKFMLDHLTTSEVDALLNRIDTHRSRGSGG